jgi:hypothetical protein
MIALQNPSGCRSVRHRIYRAKRPTLLQRIASAFYAPAAAMVEHLDNLGGQQ